MGVRSKSEGWEKIKVFGKGELRENRRNQKNESEKCMMMNDVRCRAG